MGRICSGGWGSRIYLLLVPQSQEQCPQIFLVGMLAEAGEHGPLSMEASQEPNKATDLKDEPDTKQECWIILSFHDFFH